MSSKMSHNSIYHHLLLPHMILVSLLINILAAQGSTITSTIKARVILSGSSSCVKGVLNLTESIGKPGVRFCGQLTGLNPGTKHGFHVHQFGDIFTKGCDSTGRQLNYAIEAGSHKGKHNHFGDLGNILADANGMANVDVVDPTVSLISHCEGNIEPSIINILGRGVVVHEMEDEGENLSPRLACGIIALVA